MAKNKKAFSKKNQLKIKTSSDLVRAVRGGVRGVN